jgi:hypothetical protein
MALGTDAGLAGGAWWLTDLLRSVSRDCARPPPPADPPLSAAQHRPPPEEAHSGRNFSQVFQVVALYSIQPSAFIQSQ